MEFNLKHQFSKEEARRRVQLMLDEMRSKLGDKATIDEERWEGDTLHFATTVEKQQISGTVAVSEQAYDIVIKLPLMLRLFEGRIKKEVEAQAAVALKQSS